MDLRFHHRPGTTVIWLRLILLVLCLLSSVPIQAQTPAEIDKANRAAEQIQREQQERLQQQLLKDRQRGKETPSQEVPEVKPPTLPKTGVCREIKEIVLSGVTLLPENLVKGLVAPYQGRCLYAEDIEKLLADILKAYIDRGYIAVRPYIQAQDLNSGRLEILIVEGKVEGLLLNDRERHSVNLTTAFPFVEKNPLNLRDIEQGLDQVNRLASNSTTMEISPGKAPGESIVIITNTPSFPIGVSFSLNNLGSESTGENQGSATLSVDNPLRLNDFFNYTHSQTLFKPDRSRDSSSNTFFYSLPLGYCTLLLSYSFSDYRTPVKTFANTLVARGDSDTFRTELNWVAYRDQEQKLTTLFALNRKDSKNYLADQLLSVSSRIVTILDLDVNWTRRFPGLSVNAGLGISKGVTWFNALEDQDGINDASPHAQGVKVRYSAGVQLPFDLLGQEVSFSSQFTGQYAMQPLYGSEQITIGSYYSVRGFNSNSLSGDRGYFVRNEFSTPFPMIPRIAITPRPFVGFDAGHIQKFKYTDAATFTGAVAGVRFMGRHLSAELSVAKSIDVPSSIKREPEQYSGSVTMSF